MIGEALEMIQTLSKEMEKGPEMEDTLVKEDDRKNGLEDAPGLGLEDALGLEEGLGLEDAQAEDAQAEKGLTNGLIKGLGLVVVPEDAQ